jgi:cell division protein FtsB
MRFKRSSLLTKILILVLVVYATVTLVSLESQVAEKTAEAAALEHSIDAAKQENLRLEQAIDTLDTDEGVVAAARQKLGWVTEGEIVFYDMGN